MVIRWMLESKDPRRPTSSQGNRCRSRLSGLETPYQMFSAAAQLDLEARLSQMIRWKAAQETMGLPRAPHLFMNTHPVELKQEGLIESIRALRAMNPRSAMPAC